MKKRQSVYIFDTLNCQKSVNLRRNDKISLTDVNMSVADV